MPPPTNPGTRVEYLRFPAFAVDWSTTHAAYCGGGGSAKTGVSNSIVLIPNRGGVVGVVRPGDAGIGVGVTIDTEDQICVGMALHPRMDAQPSLLAAVGREVRLYDATSGAVSGKFVCPDMVNCVSFDRGGKFAAAGCEDGTVLTFSLEWREEDDGGGDGDDDKDDGGWQKVNPDGSTTPAEESDRPRQQPPPGGQRRRIAVFNRMAECRGHTKAVSDVSFNPTTDVGDFFECLSCGKDGTCRIWDATTGDELATLQCTVDDPGSAPPTGGGGAKTKRNARVDQVLVRSCVYGSDGRTVYAVCSRRRGRSVVSRWRYLVQSQRPPPRTPQQRPPQQQPQPQQQPPQQPPGAGVGPPPTSQPPQPQQPQPQQPEVQGRYVEVERAVVSSKPVSAFVMNSTRTTLYFGDVDGTITVMDGETLSVRRKFEEVHDLPVTGMAARPGGLVSRVGGEDEDVAVLSASADCRMVFLSMRREPPVSTSTLIKILVTILVIFAALYASYDRCGTHLGVGRLIASSFPSSLADGNDEEIVEFGDCVLRSLVAPGDVPGVSVIPY